MSSLIGIHATKNGIKQLPSRAILSLNGVGLGGDEIHQDTIKIVRDTRVFPDGEAPPDFNSFVPGDVTWQQYGEYWYSQRTENGGSFKNAWNLNPADYYQICNEQGGNDAWALQRLVDIERAISQAANADGRQCCILNLAGGTPGDFELWKQIIAPFILEVWQNGRNIYGRHCYADKFVNDDGSIVPGQPQRIIDELEYLKSQGYQGGMVLTECGLYGGYGVANYTYFEQQAKRWEAALMAYADIFIGLCWWEGGNTGFNADYTNHLKALVPYMQSVTLSRWQPNEEPNMKHKAIVVKLPQDMTATEWNEAAAEAFQFRHTLTASHDDMLTILNGGNESSYVKFSHPERDSDAVALVEAAGYVWQPLYDMPPPPTIEIIDIVDDLPKHATKKYALRLPTDITTLTIHHTVSPPDRSIESIAAYHVDSNDWPGIGYHFVLKDDGRICQTNYLTTKSYHAGSSAAPGDENAISVGIALQGDFTNVPPPQAQLDAARQLVAYLRGELVNVTDVLGHRQMPGASTACPGATWQQWLPYITGEIDNPLPPPVVIPPPAPVLVDVAPYFVPDSQYGRKIVMKTGNGTQPMQLEKRPSDVILRKGDGNWIDGIRYQDSEQWRVKDGQIQKGKDTSDAGNGGRDGYDLGWAEWLPQFVQVGATYHSTPTVKRFDRTNNCQVYSESQADDWLYIKAIIPTWISPANNSIVLNNVLVIEWRSGTSDLSVPPNEVYYFAKNISYVGWGSHFIVEITDGQQPLSGKLDCGM